MIFVMICTRSGKVFPVAYTKESQLQINAEKFQDTIFFYEHTEEELEKMALFAKQLEHPCPECGAEVGELCPSGGVWIHKSRFDVATREIQAP